jgi:hypothetical protein
MNKLKRFSIFSTICVLIVMNIGHSQTLPVSELKDSKSNLTMLSAEKKRTSGLSFGGGLQWALEQDKYDKGFNIFINYLGNLSDMFALRGGLGVLWMIPAGDLEDIYDDQIVFFGSLAGLLGQLNRNNPVNYYALAELRGGPGLESVFGIIENEIAGKEEEGYFDVALNVGGGVSFKIAGNTRFYLEPLVSFSSKYNAFILRGAFEF